MIRTLIATPKLPEGHYNLVQNLTVKTAHARPLAEAIITSLIGFLLGLGKNWICW